MPLSPTMLADAKSWYPTGDPLSAAHAIASAMPSAPPLAQAVQTIGDSVAPPPAAGPRSSVDVPGYNPDYNSLLTSDPTYLAWANAHPGVVADAGTARKAALRAMAMQYGGLPQGFQDQYGDLTPEDIAAAQANPYSSQHMLQSEYQTNVENARKGLAARGQLHSGDLGYAQGQLDTQLGASQYALGNQFSSNFQSAINDYLNALSGDETARRGAIGQAYQDVVSNPAYQPVAGGAATLVPTWQSDYGQPVYQTTDGRLYSLDASGNPVLYTGG